MVFYSCNDTKTIALKEPEWYPRPIKSIYFKNISKELIEDSQKVDKSRNYFDAQEMDNELNDDIILTLTNPKFNFKKKVDKYDLIYKFSKVQLSFYNLQHTFNKPQLYRNFLPFESNAVNIIHKTSHPLYLSRETNHFFGFNYNYQTVKYLKRKDYCVDIKAHNIKYNYFPHKFYFPKDFIPLTTLCPSYDIKSHRRNKKIANNESSLAGYYFSLDFPNTVYFKQCETKKETIDSLKKNNEKHALKEICTDSYFLLIKTNILLEPAFVTYREEIATLWQLYLANIRFNELQDTIFNTRTYESKELSNGIYRKPMVDLIQERYYHTYPEYRQKSIDKIRNYLKKDFSAQQEIYKSYFELILWKMYECSEFTVNRKEYDKASFTFTSNNPKYSGNYEVFFSIYEPNLFKVKKRR